MTFNPSSIFVNTGNLSSAQAKRLEQRDEADVPVQRRVHPLVALLREAAREFDGRRDNFALGKAATCLDLAFKLEKYGSFVSDRQEEYARKLVEWAKPRNVSTVGWQRDVDARMGATTTQPMPKAPVAPAVTLPRLFDLMQRLAKLEIGNLKLARKNGDSLCWVKLADHEGVVGKIEAGKLVIFAGRLRHGSSVEALTQRLLEIEADPEAAAVLHGKASGRCAVCSRDLTDPESIERGIGPICAEKF